MGALLRSSEERHNTVAKMAKLLRFLLITQIIASILRYLTKGTSPRQLPCSDGSEFAVNPKYRHDDWLHRRSILKSANLRVRSLYLLRGRDDNLGMLRKNIYGLFGAVISSKVLATRVSHVIFAILFTTRKLRQSCWLVGIGVGWLLTILHRIEPIQRLHKLQTSFYRPTLSHG